MVDERHEGPLGHNEGGFPTGRDDQGWQQPGATSAASAAPQGGFGQAMAPPSGPAIAGPTIPSPPGMSPPIPPPGGAGFVVTGGPKRSRSPWVVFGVIAALFVVLIGGCAALIAVGGSGDSYDSSFDETYADDYLYDRYGNDLSPDTVAPPVVIPPADAAAATGQIVELYDRVFTPAASPELWATLFTDPEGLGPLGERLESSACAAGAQAVVTAVQFTSDDSAVVRFRFEGPNVPEFGRDYAFEGGATRAPGEPWKATPDGVISVVETSAGYC